MPRCVDALVCYSLYAPPDEPRPDLLRQLVTSVHTLRRYSRTVPVVVFVHGEPPAELALALAPYDVGIHAQGAYEARLARLCPAGWPVLARYPLLHKLLNFAEIARLAPSRLLLLDCDTIFFDDVERLLARYSHAHCCAREEPTCARSHYGYDPGYVDEDALAALAASLGVRTVPPFNIGVLLFNHGIWDTLAALDRTFVDYAWRLLLSLALHPDEERVSRYGEMDAVTLLRQHARRIVTPDEAARALPFPSANAWIVDQVALWLALGHVDGLSYADFRAEHVLQNGEMLSHPGPAPGWVLCHYYSQNMGRTEEWLHRAATLETRH